MSHKPTPTLAQMQTQHEAAVLKMLPNCQFLIEIENHIYSGTSNRTTTVMGRCEPITQDEFLQLMADLRAFLASLPERDKRIAEVAVKMSFDVCDGHGWVDPPLYVDILARVDGEKETS
jgi:hypothetical protein